MRVKDEGIYIEDVPVSPKGERLLHLSILLTSASQINQPKLRHFTQTLFSILNEPWTKYLTK